MPVNDNLPLQAIILQTKNKTINFFIDMTHEEIINGNKLIAEFMGAEIVDINKPQLRKGERCYFPQTQKNPTYNGTHIAELKYNTSFDWLMPVIEKIELLDSIGKVLIQYFTLFSGTGCYKIQIGRDSEDNKTPDTFPIEVTKFIKEPNTQTKIQAIWLAVVEFINWYNQQK